jgi:hypothetical protein
MHISSTVNTLCSKSEFKDDVAVLNGECLMHISHVGLSGKATVLILQGSSTPPDWQPSTHRLALNGPAMLLCQQLLLLAASS